MTRDKPLTDDKKEQAQPTLADLAVAVTTTITKTRKTLIAAAQKADAANAPHQRIANAAHVPLTEVTSWLESPHPAVRGRPLSAKSALAAVKSAHATGLTEVKSLLKEMAGLARDGAGGPVPRTKMGRWAAKAVTEKERIQYTLAALAVEHAAATGKVARSTDELVAAAQVADAAKVPHQQLASAAQVFRPTLKSWLNRPHGVPREVPHAEAALAAVADAGAARAAARQEAKDIVDKMAATVHEGDASDVPQMFMAEWAGVAISTVRVWLGLRQYNEGR